MLIILSWDRIHVFQTRNCTLVRIYMASNGKPRLVHLTPGNFGRNTRVKNN